MAIPRNLVVYICDTTPTNPGLNVNGHLYWHDDQWTETPNPYGDQAVITALQDRFGDEPLSLLILPYAGKRARRMALLAVNAICSSIKDIAHRILAVVHDDGVNNRGKRLLAHGLSFPIPHLTSATEILSGTKVAESDDIVAIWASDLYRVWYEGPSPLPDHCVVSMPQAELQDGFTYTPFGKAWFSKRAIPTIYVVSRHAHWFQDDEIFKVADRIRAFLGPHCALTIYGNSMGGYGALLLSGPLNVDTCIAMAPQFTIDLAVLPHEQRWLSNSEAIGAFRHDLRSLISATARKVILYDNCSPDREHVMLMQPDDETWDLAAIPFSSHRIAKFLLEVDALKLVMENVPGAGPDTSALVRYAHANRRKSNIYQRHILKRLRQTRPELAGSVMERYQQISSES